jgi:hypothetical protein
LRCGRISLTLDAGSPILPPFGSDVVGAIFGTGAAPLRHHGVSIGAPVGLGARSHPAGGCAQVRKQQCATRSGLVRVPGRRRPDHGAVGQLSIAPSPKRFDQMMKAAKAFQIRRLSGAALAGWNGVVDIGFGGGAVTAGEPAGQVAAPHEIG